MQLLFTPLLRRLLLSLSCLITPFWGFHDAFGQLYYQPQTYGQLNPPIGLLGQMYNHQTYLMTNVPTTYHGNQNVYATVYLPFAPAEYNFNFALEPFGTHYTTAVALSSPKDHALGLYAPVQVIGSSGKNNYALASIIPYDDNRYDYKGPFNTLPTLNTQDPNFINPIFSEYGVTALETAQKFTKFSHELLIGSDNQGWNGFDKAGNIPVLLKISPVTGISSYFPISETIQITRNNFGDMDLSRADIGHEMAHGITYHIPGYDIPNVSTSKKELDEGFADIIGLSFCKWLTYGQLDNPQWDFKWEQVPGPNSWSRRLDAPKINFPQSPDTYLGEFYETDPQSQGYDVHRNGMVLSYWFYLITTAKKDFVDENPSKPYYNVGLLIPGNKEENYKLALRILFTAFTEKLKANADYPDVRHATLQVATELGYAPGSDIYNQLVYAWSAVGVEEPPFNKECVVKTAQSVFNGPVSFNAQEETLQPNFLSAKISLLNDCTDSNPVSTSWNKNQHAYFTDWDDDQIYSGVNDLNNSQFGVSVHAFTQVARDWYKNKLNHNGMDGSGHFPIKNIFSKTEGAASLFMDLPTKSATFTYTYDKKWGNRDQISKNYFSGVDNFLKQNPPQAINNEWETIITSIGDIFSLEIKKDYELKQQNLNADKIWTLNEDLSDPAAVVDFANPKLYGQAALYHGLNWDENKSAKNAGVINLWYYLLIHGSGNPDDPNDQGGYTNMEIPDKTYYVFPQNKDLVLKVIWEAYKGLSINSSIEKFRLATHAALVQILGPDFDPKGKEFIAFTDAWAAVLGQPDYASTLKHTPENGEQVYPWAAKVGVEVEYPKYESERLFEVSKSPTFKSIEAPVYQFISNAAPDLATGMTFGLVNLELSQTYYVRSRLSNSGDPRLGCQATKDPAFCESLKGKRKWTVTYEFKTGDVPVIGDMSPAPGSMAPAWETPFNWTNVTGSRSYELVVTDNSGEVTEQLLSYPNTDDESVYKVYQDLALGQKKSYTYKLAAKQKLGSEWACHVMPNGMTLPFSQDEKDAFEDVFNPWTQPVTFNTDEPTVVLHNEPSDKEHVAILGPDIVLRASEEKRADYYRFFISEQPTQFKLDTAMLPVKVSTMAGLEDKKMYKWTMDLFKEPVAPFIPVLEKGKAPEMHSFVVDMSLSPAPEIKGTGCIVSGKPVSFGWGPVEGATAFSLQIFDAITNELVAEGSTSDTDMDINEVSKFPDPAKYSWTVKAGVKDAGGKTMFGPESGDFYFVGPPPCHSLVPNGTDESYGGSNLNEGGLTLSWQADFAPEGYWLQVENLNNSTFEVDQQVNTNSVLIKGLNFDTEYRWRVKPIGADGDCNIAEASFRTYRTGQNYKSKVEVEDQGESGGSLGGNGNPGGNDNPGEDPPADEGACPGTILVSIKNSEQIEISLLSNKLGDSEVHEGVTDINTNVFFPLLADGMSLFPGTIFNANDQVVLRIKVKSLGQSWVDLPFEEIPVVTFETSGGQIMTYKFNFDDWQLDKEILMGTYHCANE